MKVSDRKNFTRRYWTHVVICRQIRTEVSCANIKRPSEPWLHISLGRRCDGVPEHTNVGDFAFNDISNLQPIWRRAASRNSFRRTCQDCGAWKQRHVVTQPLYNLSTCEDHVCSITVLLYSTIHSRHDAELLRIRNFLTRNKYWPQRTECVKRFALDPLTTTC